MTGGNTNTTDYDHRTGGKTAEILHKSLMEIAQHEAIIEISNKQNVLDDNDKSANDNQDESQKEKLLTNSTS